MADVRVVRRYVWKLLALLAVIDLAAAALLLSPIRSSSAVRQQQLNQLWAELQDKTREAVPLRGIDKKVEQAQEEIQQFYVARFPDSFAAVSTQLGTLAKDNGVQLTTASYATEDTDLPELRRVWIKARISGDYTREVQFINALERSKNFFLVDSVGLQEVTGKNVGVNLQIGAETYLRTAGLPSSDETRHGK